MAPISAKADRVEIWRKRTRGFWIKVLMWDHSLYNLSDCFECVFEQGLVPDNSSEFNIAHDIDQSVYELLPSHSECFGWICQTHVKNTKNTAPTAWHVLSLGKNLCTHIHCEGEHVFLTHHFNFFHDEIGNEGLLFVSFCQGVVLHPSVAEVEWYAVSVCRLPPNLLSLTTFPLQIYIGDFVSSWQIENLCGKNWSHSETWHTLGQPRERRQVHKI